MSRQSAPPSAKQPFGLFNRWNQLGLTTKFLLASSIPTLLIVIALIGLYVMQLNRIVIRQQVEESLTIPAILEKTISSREILNYRNLIQSAIMLMINLRQHFSKITIYAYEAERFKVIASTDAEAFGQEPPLQEAQALQRGKHAVYKRVENGRKILQVFSYLYFEGTPVGLVSVVSPLDVQDTSMIYLRGLIFFLAPAGGGILWVLIYVSFRKIFLSRLSTLTRASKGIAEGRWPTDIPVTGRDELSTLEEAFNQMSSSRRQFEENLSGALSLNEATLESTTDGILAVDNTGEIKSFNQNFIKMWRIPEGILSSREDNKALEYVLNQLKDPEVFIQKVRELYAQPWAESYDLLEFKDGRVFERYSKPQQIEGRCTGRVWSFRDITERKRAEEALAHQAIHDTLTNLYNRRYFNQRIEEEIARASRNHESMALLLCDLDHFKEINDNLGHQVGDEVLKMVARGICDATRGTDLVFRWGGDEIMIILSDITTEGVLLTAERIRKAIKKIGKNSDQDLDISIGVAFYPEHGQNIDGLIRLADRALYIAKKWGDKIHLGEEEYHLDEHIIKIVFQPLVDIRSNRIFGYEALSRDIHGKMNILELFRKYQTIGRLYELKCLCFRSQIKKAGELGLAKVFINIDFNLLSQSALEPIPPGLEVVLEISEMEALHDIENHLAVTRKWREKGYKFAIDDFGAGFISLPFIARLIPEYIKLDRSTVLQSVSSATFRMFSKDMVKALQNYAGEGIIAEGIETEKELHVVKEMGVYLAQGYLLGRPQELG